MRVCRPSRSRRPPANYSAAFNTSAISQIAAERAGRLKAFWKKKGHALGLPTCSSRQWLWSAAFTLATDNRKHFPMPELKLLALPALH